MRKRIGLGLVIFIITTIMIGCVATKPKVPNKPSTLEEIGKEVNLDKIHKDIKKELGKAYTPDMKLEKTNLSELININEMDIEEFIAEISMNNVYVDTFIAIKAADGKAEIIEEALIEYTETILENSMQYPINIAKVNASEVLREGDYIFFLMLGNYNDRENIAGKDANQYALLQTKTIKDIVLKNFN